MTSLLALASSATSSFAMRFRPVAFSLSTGHLARAVVLRGFGDRRARRRLLEVFAGRRLEFLRRLVLALARRDLGMGVDVDRHQLLDVHRRLLRGSPAAS
jgi:hypothetical protein